MTPALEQIALSRGITLADALQRQAEAAAAVLKHCDVHPAHPIPVHMRDELRTAQILLTAAYAAAVNEGKL